MKKKHVVIGVLATSAIVAATTINTAFASSNDYHGSNCGHNRITINWGMLFGRQHNNKTYRKMIEALNDNDYSKWREARDDMDVRNQRLDHVINKDNFSRFSEAYRLMRRGKYAEASKILRDLGLGNSSMQWDRKDCDKRDHEGNWNERNNDHRNNDWNNRDNDHRNRDWNNRNNDNQDHGNWNNDNRDNQNRDNDHRDTQDHQRDHQSDGRDTNSSDHHYDQNTSRNN